MSKKRQSKKLGRSKPPQIVARARQMPVRPAEAGAKAIRVGPSPTKIARIMRARRQAEAAYMDVMRDALLETIDVESVAARAYREHGAHLDFVWDHHRARRNEFIGEGAWFFRQYRAQFARFGGDRPYLNQAAYEDSEAQYMTQLLPQVVQASETMFEELPPKIAEALRAMRDPELARRLALASDKEKARLEDLLLRDHWLVADILAEEPPPRPADWPSPRRAEYAQSVAGFLDFGPLLEIDWEVSLRRDPLLGQEAVPEDLLRMATDPGLLGGWPGDPAAWAPIHAMGLMGVLDLSDQAESLREILEPQGWDDWYSDYLFEHCLGRMGPAVEPFLWSLIEDRKLEVETRGLGLCALREIAGRHPARREAITVEIAEFMQGKSRLDRRRKTLNSFAAHLLHGKLFPQAITDPAIAAAHAAGRLDLKVYNPDDFEDDWF
jgi:hypothetical protein